MSSVSLKPTNLKPTQNLFTTATQRLLQEFRLSHLIGCFVLISLLSAYDTYLVFYFRETILVLEQNPICHFLIRCNHNTLSYFLVGKIIGTLSAILVMSSVYFWNRRIGIPVVMAITVFQILLIAYQYAS